MPRTDLIAIPKRMQHLARDPRGYPIPAGVFRDNEGRPHFTVNDEGFRTLCLLDDLCPICGTKLAPLRWFVGGVRSAFHERGAYYDPPMHGDCMRYALRVCPYLAAPNYGKRLDARTVRTDEPARIFWDETQIEDRPILFVAVLARGQRLTRPAFYVAPTRPYRGVEFWRHGKLVGSVEGQRIVAEVMGQPLPRQKPHRLVKARS